MRLVLVQAQAVKTRSGWAEIRHDGPKSEGIDGPQAREKVPGSTRSFGPSIQLNDGNARFFKLEAETVSAKNGLNGARQRQRNAMNEAIRNH